MSEHAKSLVERLREHGRNLWESEGISDDDLLYAGNIMRQAADRIDQLEAKIRILREGDWAE